MIGTQELSNDDAAKLFGYRRSEAIMLLSKQEVTKEQVDDVVSVKNDLPTAPIQEGKSKSQRLRGVMFRIWEQTDKSIDFNQYYDKWMENIIQTLKNKHLD